MRLFAYLVDALRAEHERVQLSRRRGRYMVPLKANARELKVRCANGTKQCKICHF